MNDSRKSTLMLAVALILLATMVAEIEADMAAQLARVREMERNGELEPIPEVSATAQ